MITQTRKLATVRRQDLSTGTNWGNIQEDWRNLIHTKLISDFATVLDKNMVNTLYSFEWKSFSTCRDTYRQIVRYYEHFAVVHDDRWGLCITLVEPELAEISYIDKPSVERLLNHIGRRVLERIISIINELSRRNGWNLSKIEICCVRDPDVKDWEYILIRLLFPTDFDTADLYLHDLYKELDKLNVELSSKERDRFQKLFYYDVIATAV
jgi:hypothetical protein